MKPKALIIKLGHSETLDAEISRTSSLGDVLRTTVVLHELKDHHITWLVDEAAYELIENNPYIDRPMVYDLSSVLQLQNEYYDTIINFEKVPGICALAENIKARHRFGFGFDPILGEATSRDGAEKVFTLCKNISDKKNHSESWQKILIEMIGGKWNFQEYVLGYQPKSKPVYDFGFNFVVGPKWPTKAWSLNNWKSLESKMAAKGKSVSWQTGLANLKEYMEWINSCHTLVTCDSLGFHLALALKKRVVVLYGPTNSNETFMYNRGIGVKAQNFSCMPCLQPKCVNDTFCMDSISVDSVFAAALLVKESSSPNFQPSILPHPAKWPNDEAAISS